MKIAQFTVCIDELGNLTDISRGEFQVVAKGSELTDPKVIEFHDNWLKAQDKSLHAPAETSAMKGPKSTKRGRKTDVSH